MNNRPVVCHTGQFKYMYVLHVILAPPVCRVYLHAVGYTVAPRVCCMLHILSLTPHPCCIRYTWMVSGLPGDEGRAMFLGRTHKRSLVILSSDTIPTIIQKWCAWIPAPFTYCTTRDGATSLTVRKRVPEWIINWRKSQNQKLLNNSGSVYKPNGAF